MKKGITLLLVCFFVTGFSQKKTLQTKFISDKISIDAKLDEAIWNSVQPATDFISFDPDNGHPISENKKTEVKVLYDNEAIYIGAILYDDEPNKILKEIAARDGEGVSDKFEVWINGFNDGQQDFRFFVTASNGQLDCVYTNSNGEDFSWDAVWESKAIITDFGWAVEMKIPYSALRFSSSKKQTWGINFLRNIKRNRQDYTWNFVDKKTSNTLQQAGIIDGIENIKTSTRLFLLPYSSFYVNADAQDKTKGTLKGGLDIKYGINDAFTLDAVLIPDFGQTKYDNKILNLSPFEQQFNENRPFFTEGTDLFSKGNLLYSRRIGGSPTGLPTLAANEEIAETPKTVSLINALKVSGRTKNGLGIGILNAVTEKTYATIRNTNNGETRKELIEPLTNFNVLVLDQRFRQNSSVSFVNTNVTRNGNFRDANVSALVWDLNTKKSTYGLQGNYKYSHVNDNEIYNGYNTYLEFNKTSGKYRYGVGSDWLSKNFDNNDLGINFETNYYSFYGNVSYRILNPTKHFNSFDVHLNIYNEFQNETDKVKAANFNLNFNAANLKNHNFGMGMNFNPFETFDFYESRVEGRYSIIPKNYGAWFYISTNYNNKFAFDINPNFGFASEKFRNTYGISMSPRYRFNDRFLLIYNFSFNRRNNTKGYVNVSDLDLDNNPTTENDIIYAKRNIISYSNSISGKYALNSKMTFNLSVRHYWSFSENKSFYKLEQNGTYTDYSGVTEITDRNKNFNSWNLDLSYSWVFAPGSQMSILYRNSAGNFNSEIDKNFSHNVTNLLNNDSLSHVFSISLKYFIDYNRAKNWF